MGRIRQQTGISWHGIDLDPQRDPILDKRFPKLSTAREFVRNAASSPRAASCPCCGQYAKVYKRHITGAMACALVQIYRWFYYRGWPNNWLHVPQHLAAQHFSPSVQASWHGGDWSKLRYWQLIEPKPGVRNDGSTRVGFYKITELGRGFVERKMEVPKYAYVYAQIFLGLDLPYVTIDDALGSSFNYDKLMG